MTAMTPEIQAIVTLAREAAASVRPSSAWAKRVLAGQRDDDDAVRAALAALKAAPTSDGEARQTDRVAGPLTREEKDAIGAYMDRHCPHRAKETAWDAVSAMNDVLAARATIAPSAAPVGDLREALAVGETFLNKCNAAWAAGEPSHRVRDMLDAADKFRTALSALAATPGPVDAEGFVVTDADIELGARQMRAVIDDGGYDDETALYSAIETMGGRVVDNAALAVAPKAADLQTGEGE